jgi:hypothetical protein
LNQANPFDYLTQLQRHTDQLAAGPPLWMPWNYRAALTLRLSASPDLHVTATERTVSPDGLIA